MVNTMMENIWKIEAVEKLKDKLRPKVSPLAFEWMHDNRIRRIQLIFSLPIEPLQQMNPMSVEIALEGQEQVVEAEAEAVADVQGFGQQFVGETLDDKEYIARFLVSGVEFLPFELLGEEEAKKLLLKANSEQIASILAKELLLQKKIKLLKPNLRETVINWAQYWIEGFCCPSMGTLCIWLIVIGAYFLIPKVDDFTLWLSTYLKEWAKSGHPPLLTIAPRIALFK